MTNAFRSPPENHLCNSTGLLCDPIPGLLGQPGVQEGSHIPHEQTGRSESLIEFELHSAQDQHAPSEP